MALARVRGDFAERELSKTLTTFKVASPTNTRLKETLTTAFMMRMSPFCGL